MVLLLIPFCSLISIIQWDRISACQTQMYPADPFSPTPCTLRNKIKEHLRLPLVMKSELTSARLGPGINATCPSRAHTMADTGLFPVPCLLHSPAVSLVAAKDTDSPCNCSNGVLEVRTLLLLSGSFIVFLLRTLNRRDKNPWGVTAGWLTVRIH